MVGMGGLYHRPVCSLGNARSYEKEREITLPRENFDLGG